MRRLVGTIVMALAGVALTAPAASADGGNYPSNAPLVASGATVTGGATAPQTVSPNSAGKSGVQYYKVAVGFGDRLTVDFATVTGDATALCVFAPTTTDFTVGSQNCLESGSTGSSGKAQLQFVAPTAGDYLLAISAYYYKPWAYSMTPYVAKTTTVEASAPATAKVGRKIKVAGQVSPGLAVPVKLQLKQRGVGWATVGEKTSAADGAFKLTYRTSGRGLYKMRVLFEGAPGYLGDTSGKIKVRVR
ncbi:hypothetical protein [Nocardioides flavescens]|uniref:Ig-like domain (Group 3) n=1 Tax=Nocardioides flavescens TaxID=2691959 RepID=A0A6L7ERW4_9ACTN|nr:hypothetical protein [Nocardioides flavescens]MXG90187.1 hypothetical protein [Nocardioides flavescens]